MIRKPWGNFHVASAYDVAALLRYVPVDLFTGDPPVWGEETDRARDLRAQGFEIWSWDTEGVTFSPPGAYPPTVLYRDWHCFAADAEAITERMPERMAAPSSSP